MSLEIIKDNLLFNIDKYTKLYSEITNPHEKLELLSVLSELYMHAGISIYMTRLDTAGLRFHFIRSLELGMESIKKSKEYGLSNKYVCSSNLSSIYVALALKSDTLINLNSQVIETSFCKDYEFFQDYTFSKYIQTLIAHNFSHTDVVLSQFNEWVSSEEGDNENKINIFRAVGAKDSDWFHSSIYDYLQDYETSIEHKLSSAIIVDENLYLKKIFSLEAIGFINVAVRCGIKVRDKYDLVPFVNIK